MTKIRSLDIKYSLTQVLYFGAFCALLGYSSVYLLDQGISNSLIGTILALISVIGVFTQPFIATFADKKKDIKLQTMIISFLIIAVALSVGIYFIKDATMLILCVFVGIATCMITIQPLLNSLAFMFEKQGIQINYALARGFGSAAYALISIAIGYLLDSYDSSILPLIYLTLNILLIVVVYTFVVPKNQEKEIVEETTEITDNTQQLSILAFGKEYKRFMIFILGSVLVFFTHTIINNFFIQIITPLGGTEKEMGTAIFLAAILELPAMGMFDMIRKKVGCIPLLKISAFLFALKHTLTFFSTSMGMIYMAQIFQIGAYAIFIPASVYYANEIISKKDLVKGQSLITVGITASGIVANLIGGFLLDEVGVQGVRSLGIVVSFIGFIVVYLAVGKQKKEVLKEEK